MLTNGGGIGHIFKDFLVRRDSFASIRVSDDYVSDSDSLRSSSPWAVDHSFASGSVSNWISGFINRHGITRCVSYGRWRPSPVGNRRRHIDTFIRMSSGSVVR
jgi:hypothetical protein